MSQGPGMMLLPAAPGTCPECATKHEPWNAHNQQSLFWQYAFFAQHARWPTWDDAIAHCAPEVKDHWVKALRERGIAVGEGVIP